MTERKQPETIEDTNVVTVDFGASETVLKRELATRKCRHSRFALSESSRMVSCAHCDETLDPFQLLLEYARRERFWRYYDQEVRKCQDRLAELKAEEQRVKARTRNALRRDATLAVEAEKERQLERRRRTRANALEIMKIAKRIARCAETSSEEQLSE